MYVSSAINIGPLEADTARFIHPLDRVELIRYFEQLRLAHGTVKLLGLPDVDERNDDLPLRSLFVEPRVGSEQLEAREFDENIATNATKPLLQALVEHRRLVLLGDPGAGKSTVINWLCTALAQPLENEVTGILGRLVPLPFILRDLPLGVPLTWNALLEQFLQRPIAAPLANDRVLLNQLLDSGQALILLDGVDEVGSIDRREALRDAVWEGWANSRCQWVLSSRIVGYSEVDFVQSLSFGHFAGHGDLNKKFRDVTIAKTYYENSIYNMAKFDQMFEQNELYRSLAAKKVKTSFKVKPGVQWTESIIAAFRDIQFGERLYLSPFSDAQVRQFIVNWFRLREPDSGLARETTKNLIEALEADPGTKELARIPNLLTLIALIYRVRAKLPDGRAELYLQISQAYLKTIDEFRKLTDLPPYTFEEKMSWLARIGWEMQQARAANGEARDGGGKSHQPPREYLATKNEVRGWFQTAMQARFGNKAGVEAERFLDYVQRRTGLLLERGEGRFAFLHLSFQEFFAGRHLAARVVTPAWTMANLAGTKRPRANDLTSALALRSYCGSSLWQETLVFVMETLSLDWAEPVLAKLYPESLANRKKVRPNDGDYSREGFARWLLAARLAGDPHVPLPDEFRERIMRACWRWELARCSEERVEYIFDETSGVARQLLARRDTQSIGWATLGQTFSEFAAKIRLDLSGCAALIDLTPLTALSGLRMLDLSRCTVLGDLSPLAKLSKLQWLDLSGCSAVSDLSPLAKIPALQWLDLSGCTSLSDLSHLSMLTNLQTLNLTGRSTLSDLSQIAKLSSLQSLNLQECTALSDLSPLVNLSGLQRLHLYNCISLSDLSPLAKLSDLQILGLSGCAALGDLSPLATISGLRTLHLSGCTMLGDLSPIKKLLGLQTLNLANCTALSDFSPLEKLSGLHSLYASGCTLLTDLSPLEKLTGLQNLDLSGCTALSDLSPIAKLSDLQTLLLSGCTELSDLSPLEKLSDLQRIYLSGCKALSDLSPLEKLPNLKFLWLGDEWNRFPKLISVMKKHGVQIY